jgi:2-polyprenyl-3-methyl-5-hydroxy-6-metoxy-1,4-benzoquinol methylase
MSNSRFNVLFPFLSTSHAEFLEKVYPGYRLRRVQDSLRSLFNSFCYAPVWMGLPLTLNEWRSQEVDKNTFLWLHENTVSVIPEFHSELSAVFRTQSNLTLKQALGLIRCGLLECKKSWQASEIQASIFAGAGKSVVQWDSEVNFPRKTIVQSFIKGLNLAPKSIGPVLLHGSLADGNVLDGYSDFDLLIVLRPKVLDSDELMLTTIEWLVHLNTTLLAYNPCMHHGPMIVFDEELKHCSPARLPSVLIENGVWLNESPNMINYQEDPFGYISSLSIFESLFEVHITEVTDIQSAFDAIWWVSSTNLLPCLIFQIKHGKSVWKRDIFNDPCLVLPDQFHSLIFSLDNIRRRVGEWVTRRLPDLVWPLDTSLLPGVCLSYYKHLLRMTPQEVVEVGITDAIIQSGRRLWEYAAHQALSQHSLLIAAVDPMQHTFFIDWPESVSEIPIPANLVDYELARSRFLRIASSEPSVAAIYEFGQVGCPGLSDLDMLVILNDGYQGIPASLSQSNLDHETRRLMGHDPIFICKESANLLAGVFPLFHSTLIYGEAISIGFSESLSIDHQAALVSYITCVKYPTDLIWLSAQKEARWTTLLAYLNSFNHVSRCLTMLRIPLPDSVQECLRLNSDIRARFSQHSVATLGDLSIALQAMISASLQVILVLEEYWTKRFSGLALVLPLFDPVKYTHDAYLAIKNRDHTLYRDPPALSLVNIVSSLKSITALPLSQLSTELTCALSGFIQTKQQFIQLEFASNRTISSYIHNFRFCRDLDQVAPSLELARLDQLYSPRFTHFMFALNAFAVEHGLRTMLNWSKVWEYPWSWFGCLSKQDWLGKHIIDIGSEIGPMPWFLASLGARVTLIETDSQWTDTWLKLREKLQVDVSWHVVSDECLPVPDACADTVTTFSVIEHQPHKERAIDEVARVLKPGGSFVISFDICEPEMLMTFPVWNGQALTMRQFEDIVWLHPAFGNTERPQWNTQDIPHFLEWHLQSAPHHNYVVGAAALTKRH